MAKAKRDLRSSRRASRDNGKCFSWIDWEENSLPTLPAFKCELKNGLIGLAAWCPHCKQWHYHTMPPGRLMPTHKTAHCRDASSPFRTSGYILELVQLPHGARAVLKGGG